MVIASPSSIQKKKKYIYINTYIHIHVHTYTKYKHKIQIELVYAYRLKPSSCCSFHTREGEKHVSLMCLFWLKRHKVHVPFGHRGKHWETNRGICHVPFELKTSKFARGHRRHDWPAGTKKCPPPRPKKDRIRDIQENWYYCGSLSITCVLHSWGLLLVVVVWWVEL